MEKVQINCEMPICLGEYWKENDFDFILYHLYLTNTKYKDFIEKFRSKNPDRTTILDNSAYEMWSKGEKLNIDNFKRVINSLKPTYYILPDVLQDMQKTLDGSLKMLNEIEIEDSEPIAVLQGRNKREFMKCFNIYVEAGIKYIGIPFHNEFYKEHTGNIYNSYKDEFLDYYKLYNDKFYIYYTNNYNNLLYAVGRVSFMDELIDYVDEHNIDVKFHMLGSHCVYEKNFYNKLNSSYKKEYIKSMDTSTPVKHAMWNINTYSSLEKPSLLLDDFVCNEYNDSVKDKIKYNFNFFKNL